MSEQHHPNVDADVVAKKPLRRHLTRWIVGLLALLICAVAIQFIPYPYQRISGNLCDNPPDGYCYEPGWKHGIPFAWERGSLVSAALSGVDERLLLLDIVISLFGMGVVVATGRYITKKRKKQKDEEKKYGVVGIKMTKI